MMSSINVPDSTLSHNDFGFHSHLASWRPAPRTAAQHLPSQSQAPRSAAQHLPSRNRATLSAPLPVLVKFKKKIGLMQVFFGVVLISFGIVVLTAYKTVRILAIAIGTPFWTAVFFLTSGVMSLSLQSRSPPKYIKATMVVSELSVVAALAGTILFAFGIVSHFRSEDCLISDFYPFGCVEKISSAYIAEAVFLIAMLSSSFVEIYLGTVTAIFANKLYKNLYSHNTAQLVYTVQNLNVEDHEVPSAPMPERLEIPLDQGLAVIPGLPALSPPPYSLELPPYDSLEPPPSYFKVFPGDTIVP